MQAHTPTKGHFHLAHQQNLPVPDFLLKKNRQSRCFLKFLFPYAKQSIGAESVAHQM
jgi:hypothetical protein